MRSSPPNRTLLRYCLGACCGRTASEGFPLAAVLLVGQHYGAVAAGVVLAAARFPQAITGPLFGAMVDRSHDRRWWFVGGTLVGAAVFTLLAMGAGRLPILTVAIAAGGVATFDPAVTSGLSGQLSTLARVAGSQRLYALDGVAFGAAGLLGPFLVAVVAALVGVRWSMAILAAAAIAASAILGGLPWSSGGSGPQADVRRQLAAGLRVVAGPRLRYVTTVTTLSFVGLGALPVALTSLAEATGRQGAVAGIPLTVAALGGLAGSVAWARAHRAAPPARVVQACVLLTGAALGAVTFTSSWAVVVLAFAFYGLLDAPLFAATLTARDRASSPGERSAVFTTAGSLKLVAAGVGAVLGGLLAARWTPWAVFAMAAAFHLPALVRPARVTSGESSGTVHPAPLEA
jgi:MFS family permease